MLERNVYNKRLARNEPKFKIWASAGLMLTYKCNCACRFCYYKCSPKKEGLMPVNTAISAWDSLNSLAGERAKVHLTGGEPFLYFDHVEEILEQANKQKLGTLDLLETNGFWIADETKARKRLLRLKELGLRTLKFSCDAFHQEFVKIDTLRKAVALAKEILGSEQVLVRWEDRLADLSDATYQNPNKDIFLQCIQDHPCRFTGRAATHVAPWIANKKTEDFCDNRCNNAFLGAKGVHIDPYGNVFSGTCSGIIVGNVMNKTLFEIWKDFDPSTQQFINILFTKGAFGTMQHAIEHGYKPRNAYASKCHLCTDVRDFFFRKDMFHDVIGPSACYEEDAILNEL